MAIVKVHVTGNQRSFVSKTGKPLTLHECYVFLSGSPYPEKIDVFPSADASVPAPGVYAVPVKVEIYQGRLGASLDFRNAKTAEDK